jgi:hypothetical protein
MGVAVEHGKGPEARVHRLPQPPFNGAEGVARITDEHVAPRDAALEGDPGPGEHPACHVERFEILGAIVGEEDLLGAHGEEEVQVPGLELGSLQSSGELWAYRLRGEHGEHLADVRFGAREEGVVLDDPACGAREFAEIPISPPGGAEPAAVRSPDRR